MPSQVPAGEGLATLGEELCTPILWHRRASGGAAEVPAFRMEDEAVLACLDTEQNKAKPAGGTGTHEGAAGSREVVSSLTFGPGAL